MRSLIVDEAGQLSIRDISVPDFNDYQCLVQLESCGICRGTDLKLIHREFKGYNDYPAILGHEGVARVVDKGKSVRSFNIGDRVLLPFIEQPIDGYFPAWGALSEFAVVGDAKALIEDGKGPGSEYFSEAYYAQQLVPPDINSVEAAMIVTFREVLSACRQFGFQPNKSVGIFGAGPVGLSFIKFCKLLGMGPVIASVTRDVKVQEAAMMGADYVFNSRVVDLVKEVRTICPDGVDFAVDAVGMNELISESMRLVAPNGSICCYGISPKLDMNLDWSYAPYNWVLKFQQWPSKLEESQAHQQIVSWIQSGSLKPEQFISEVFAFDNVVEAYDKSETASGLKKIVVKF